MRITKYSFVLLCSTLVGTCGLARPSSLPAAEHRYAAYFQPADDESDTDPAPSDEPPPPDDTTDEAPADEMPAEEDRAPAEVPTDDEPLERLPAEETPDEPAPPTPVTEDDSPVDPEPPRREVTPLPNSTITPKYDTFVPGQSHGATGTEPKGWGYNGGCCASVWDGYCAERPSCHHCGRGRGPLWCRMMCCKSKLLGCGGKCSRRHHGSCCCQYSAPSCCRASTKANGEDKVAPPVPPDPVPYASAARSSRKNSAVVLQHWDMPRITSKGGKTRR